MTEQETNEFIERIEKELETYEQEMIKKSPSEIYEAHYEIEAMEEIAGFLINYADNYKITDFPKENIVKGLFWNFIDTSYDLTQDDLREFIKYEIETYNANKTDKSLAERLDEFYSQYFPYDRYDGTGYFDKKYDIEDIGLNQIKECLSYKKGCKVVCKFLTEIIENEEDTKMLEEALKLKNDVIKEMAKFENDNEM